MSAIDVAGFVTGLAEDTRAFVGTQIQPLDQRVKALEARLERVRDGEPGRDGKDIDPLAVKAMVTEAVMGLTLQIGTLIREEVHRAIDVRPVPKDGAPGRDGKDVDLQALKAMVDAAVVTATAVIPERVKAEVAEVVGRIPAPKDGRDGASVKELEPLIQAEVARALAAHPQPRDGKDGSSVTVKDVEPLIQAEVQRHVSALPRAQDGKDGTSVTVDDVRPIVAAEVRAAVKDVPPPDVAGVVAREVAAAVAQIPKPQDGRDGSSVTVKDVEPVIQAEVQRALAAIPKPQDGPSGKDGIGIVGVLINQDGHLIHTLSDGSTKDAGRVVGRDVDMAAVQAQVSELVAAIPRPEPGAPGRDGIDGKDGLGFDDAETVFVEDKGWFYRMRQGERVKDYPLHLPWDAGVYRAGRVYPKGAMVTSRGSWWIAQADESKMPGSGQTAWRLTVKNAAEAKRG